MLAKLLKYEAKATARSFLPIYLAILLFALINRVINPFDKVSDGVSVTVEGFSFINMMRMASIVVYFALIVATIAMTFVIIIQRFYKNLLGDEGYLMFTLPVKPWQHIVSKLLISLMWIALSFIVIVSSVLVLINIDNLFGEIGRLIREARGFFGDTLLILAPISALIGASYFIMTVYNALSIGHLFNKHRILASFVAYLGIYMVGQIVGTIFLFTTAGFILEPLSKAATPEPSLIITLILAIVSLNVLLATANFISANIILSIRLNLE